MFEAGKLVRGTVVADPTASTLSGRPEGSPAPSSTAPSRKSTKKPQKEKDCTESMSAQGTQRWGGTFPTSPPVLRLPRGKMSQTSQTRTELPKLVKSESEGGGGGEKSPKSSSSAKPKSVCLSEPEDRPGSNLLVRKLPSKIENLKMFWEKTKIENEQNTAKPKLCLTNGRGVVKRNSVQTNSQNKD